MTMPQQLMLAIRLAPLLGALVLAIPAQAAPLSGGPAHHSFDSGARGDFRQHHRHDFDDRVGFGFGLWGWWDPVQYWYPYPYYYPPYPTYYGPPPAPQPPAQASGAPPQQFWYYCDNPQGYYPYVANCNSAWRQVAPSSGNTITPKAKQ